VLASLKILYKYIVNKNITTNFIDKALLLLVFCFPIIILLRSAATNIATILVSIIMLFYFFKKTQVNFFKNKLLIYIVIFFSFIFINSIIHFTSFYLLLKSLGNFRYLFLSMGVFLSLHIVSEKNKIFFIYLNIVIIFLVSMDILYQVLFYKDIFGFAPGMCTNVLPIKCQRFSGVFGEELIAGSYLSQIGFLILMLFLNLELNKNYFIFFLKIILCLFLLTIILLTGERSALLNIIVSLFFIFFFKKKIINFFLFLTILFTLIFFSSQKIESINTRYINLFDGWGSIAKDASIISKIIESPWSFHYQAAIELFIEKPIFGHGPKSFRIKCENTNIDKKTKEQRHYYRDYRACSTHPHNYLLEFLSEYGLVGGAFFIGLMFFIFASIYKILKNFKNKNTLMPIVIGSLILAIIFPLKPSGSFFGTFNASMLFYILGFFLYYLKKPE
jgi:O-antigen ligase